MNNYSQSANPNATNSELDSKKIVTNRPLTSVQKYELIEQYVEIQIDNMHHDHIVQIVTDMLTDYYEKLSDSELKESVDLYDSKLFEELVDNIVNTDSIVYNTNKGGKF